MYGHFYSKVGQNKNPLRTPYRAPFPKRRRPSVVRLIKSPVSKSLLTALALAVVCCAGLARAQEGDEIVGKWKLSQETAVIEIYKCQDRYCGKIAWTRKNDRLARSGQQERDEKNPDPRMKDRPLVGLEIMHGFVYKNENRFRDGKVYNPDDGHTYCAMMELASEDKLNVRGYVWAPLFGATTTLTRVRN